MVDSPEILAELDEKEMLADVARRCDMEREVKRLRAIMADVSAIASQHYKLTKSSTRRAFGDIADKCKEVL
ncbi:MAG: hypothetical protein WC455_22690 [Dehalococcoidia bacterium]|jgi:phage host-nuclease inhibitor protein Gam